MFRITGGVQLYSALRKGIGDGKGNFHEQTFRKDYENTDVTRTVNQNGFDLYLILLLEGLTQFSLKPRVIGKSPNWQLMNETRSVALPTSKH